MPISEPLLSVLRNRGISDIESFIRPPSIEDLPCPFLVPGVETAAAKILAIVRSQQPIAIFGDADADGITATVILRTVLKSLGANVTTYVPSREEGYGLSAAAVHRFSKTRTKLLVTVDNGIAAHAPLRLARRLGMEAIIIDHHTKAEEPETTAVWTQEYCGAGLSLLTSWAILCLAAEGDERLEAAVPETIMSLAALAAIGSIADCVPLTEGTRAITRLGLRRMERTRHAGLARLLLLAGVRGRTPTASDVAFGIAPRLNVAGRMAHPSLALQMLETNGREAVVLADHLDDLNCQRKDLERQLLDQMLSSALPAPRFAYVGYFPDWPRGLAGLLASRAAERFGIPAIILVRDQRTGLAVGSGRTVGDFDLYAALKSCESLLDHFGGHQQAAGVALDEANIDEFREAMMRESACHEWAESPLVPDATLTLDQLPTTFVSDLALLEPFGNGNPAPVFELPRCRVLKTGNGRAMLQQGAATLQVFTREIPVEAGWEGTMLVEMTSRANVLKAAA